MDKRYEPSKDYGRVNKKPKLEIIVGKGRPNQNTAGAPGTSRYTAKPASPPKSSPDDFWDDDDDEVLLMASQVVEKSSAHTVPLSSQPTRDFTFSEFAPNTKSTSTQKYFEQDVQLFSEMDDDWDDGIVEKPSVFLTSQKPKQTPVFKVPITVAPTKRPHQESERSERPFSSDLIKSATPLLGQSQLPQTGSTGNFNSNPISLSQPNVLNKNSNREKAHECQIQFLQKRADTLKKENAKITKELDDFRNKMESKDGEVSLLRDEIRHLKQQIQNAQREKLQSTDVVKTEWQDKINELAKQVEAQQTVLEFKTMEISKLKMNHGDESMRFDNSMRENLNESTTAQQTNLRTTTSNRRRMTQIQSSARLTRKIPTACSIPIEIFDQSIEKGNSKFRKDVFHREMERLQFHMSRVQYISQLKANQRTELAESVIDSAKCVIAEFWTYVHSLEYNKHSHSLPYHSYDIIKDSRQQSNRCSLFQAQVLFQNEKAINLRRYIAGLSVICKLVPEAGALLFSIQNNDYLLIQIIIDGLNKLGFSHEICHHFGVVESFAMLLDTLWDNHSEDDEYLEHLMSFLKTLVFCRPNAWASKFITLCLQKLPNTARDQLCGNARGPNFTVSQTIYKFTTESCVLQVYACLLETAFPANQELCRNEFKLLSEICYNHLIFFASCFPSPPPRFVIDILPHDDDLDEEGLMSQQPVVNIKCQCYVMMCSSVVKLLYQVMRQWQRVERKHEVKLIENIAKVGVRLLHTIYIRYYMTKLFDHKGYLTRHYLYFICKYWLESTDLLQFKETHREALDQLASSHIIEIKSQPEERNTFKVDRDLKKWYEHSGDVANEAMDCIDVDADNLSDFMKLRITERTCNAELFFKRY
ncbi:ATR-interacting protein mus304 [Episyrphus balteatus]|uniref:ATR-interacting protein mus304 n=1 Tax=Episyrphus balteatus TaxID=286459 RepID=UPI0024857654|nr:ATR-interacting protein mus304 [Episyrphus balteatus]